VGAVTPREAAILGGRWCRLACDYHESTAIFARRRGTRAAGWLGGWAAGRLGGWAAGRWLEVMQMRHLPVGEGSARGCFAGAKFGLIMLQLAELA